MIKLYLYRLGGFLDKAALASKAEQNKLVSAAAYRLISEKASELLGTDVVISKTDRGKPYIENSPLHISISHCSDAVLLAISDGEIGVDIERVREFSSHTVKRLFSEDEMKFISSGNEDQQATVLWTLREAVCKASGEGFSEWFFSCSFADEHGALIKKYGLYNLSTFDACGYICSVASVSSADDIDFCECTL